MATRREQAVGKVRRGVRHLTHTRRLANAGRRIRLVDVKQERLARFMERQAEISTAKLEAKVGTVQQCLERIRINTRWLFRNRLDVAAWLIAYAKLSESNDATPP